MRFDHDGQNVVTNEEAVSELLMEFINKRFYTAIIFTSIRYNFTINIASISTILFWAAIKNVHGIAITVCIGRNEVTLFLCASHICI